MYCQYDTAKTGGPVFRNAELKQEQINMVKFSCGTAEPCEEKLEECGIFLAKQSFIWQRCYRTKTTILAKRQGCQKR